MGQAAEALDSLLVLLRMLDERRCVRVVRQGAGRFDRTLLIFEILAVLKRQIEKCARDRRELAVEAYSHGILGSREGRMVARVGARIVAEHIAGKLVEYDRQREAALCRIAPAMEFTARRTIIIVEKETTDFRIEIRLSREPGLARLGEVLFLETVKPETKDFFEALHLSYVRVLIGSTVKEANRSWPAAQNGDGSCSPCASRNLHRRRWPPFPRGSQGISRSP